MSMTLLLCALGNTITGWCVGWLMRGDQLADAERVTAHRYDDEVSSERRPRVDPFRDIRAVNGRSGSITAGQGVAGPPLTGFATEQVRS